MLLTATVERLLPAGRVLCVEQDSGRRMPVFNMSGEVVSIGQTVYVTKQRELAKKVTYKADLWRRTTEEEAALIVESLDSQPINFKMLFQDALFLDHLHEEFALVQDVLTQLFGEERSVELLEPSFDNTAD